jgi:hypothetical protein
MKTGPHDIDRELDEAGEDAIPLFQLESWQSHLIQNELTAAVHSALKNRKLSSEEVMNLGAFLWLVERLPEHHEQYFGQINFSWDRGEGIGWTSVCFSEEGLALEYGEIIRGEYGTDSYSKTVFQVSGTRSAHYDFDFVLENWLRDFVNNAGEVEVEMSVSWYPEDERPRSYLSKGR